MNLKKIAMEKFGLVEQEKYDALKAEFEAANKSKFAIVEDTEGNFYNTVGDMITIGQELKEGDVEGEGEVAASVSFETTDGNMISTDESGYVIDIQMAGSDSEADAESEGETTEEEQSAETPQAQFGADEVSAMITDAVEANNKEFNSKMEKFMSDMLDVVSKATESAAATKEAFDKAPATTKIAVKQTYNNKKNNSLASKLQGSSNIK